jgi:hypothetical protein
VLVARHSGIVCIKKEGLVDFNSEPGGKTDGIGHCGACSPLVDAGMRLKGNSRQEVSELLATEALETQVSRGCKTI